MTFTAAEQRAGSQHIAAFSSGRTSVEIDYAFLDNAEVLWRDRDWFMECSYDPLQVASDVQGRRFRCLSALANDKQSGLPKNILQSQ
jgi:hypothetical protein